MSGGRLSIISVISIRVEEEEDGFEDEDRFVIGYTHKGEGITMVLMTGGFLERYLVIKLSFPLMCLTWKDH